MDLVFWQNIISPHQSAVMRELSVLGHSILIVASEKLSKDRIDLGWNIPDLGEAEIVIAPTRARVIEIVEDSAPLAVHVIAGARGTPLGRQVAAICRRYRRRAGIVSESPDPRGFMGLLRRLKYKLEAHTSGKKFDFIFAMGEQGERWFLDCGYPPARIFPFLYVPERSEQCHSTTLATVYRFIFVGRLISLKGVDLLLEAFSRIADVELVVIGDGPDREELHDLGRRLGLDDRIRWLGQMNSHDVWCHIAAADVLVLPSRKDGWGAVVNEALMVGTPVICSDACGASDLIGKDWLGSVIRANDVEALAAAMADWRGRGRSTSHERRRIIEWSSCIEPHAAATYFESALCNVYEMGPRPAAPWR